MTHPLVSIIVPVYNSELYLEECLNTIVHQTYQSLEIILIDDGSTDSSYAIMNSYSIRDDRIVILSQSNRGVSAARNSGLRAAKGEYVLFVDSDDTIRSDTVEVFCRQALLTNVEIVIGNVNYCYPDGVKTSFFQQSTKYSKLSYLSGKECFSQLTAENIFPPLVYLYFTKRAYVQEFEEGIVHEDVLWCIKTVIFAPTVSVLDFFHYFYRIRVGSIMQSDNKAYRASSIFHVAKALEKLSVGLQEKRDFVHVAGYVYIWIFFIYFFICELLKEINEDTNETYKAYFERLLQRIYPDLSPFQQQACSNFFNRGNRVLFSVPTLSYCITCKNQIHQIKQTLFQNMEDNRDSKDFVEFVLVDFGSDDGLQQWIIDNFISEIEEGYLKYYYTEEMQLWHDSIAKNTSHRLAKNDIVVHLDCDNFTGKNGGRFLIEQIKKYGWDKTILYQSGNESGNGPYEQISLSKSNFYKLGGYDESMEYSGSHEKDLLIRARWRALSCINQLSEKMYELTIKNINTRKIKANTDRDHIGIINNIYTFQNGNE